MQRRCAFHVTGLVAAALLAAPVFAQSIAPPIADTEAMERALQQADGPRKRILEAARPKPARPAEPPPAAAAAPAAPPTAVAPRPVPINTFVARIEPLPAVARTLAAAGPAAPVALAVPTITLPELPPLAGAVPAPKLLSRVDPELPSRLFRRGAGRIELLVQLTINADGSVADVVVPADTAGDLERPVVDAVRQWRYAPAPAARPHSLRLVITPG